MSGSSFPPLFPQFSSAESDEFGPGSHLFHGVHHDLRHPGHPAHGPDIRPPAAFLPHYTSLLAIIRHFRSVLHHFFRIPPPFPHPPSLTRFEFGKFVSICRGYLSFGFTVSLDVSATLGRQDFDNTTAQLRQGR